MTLFGIAIGLLELGLIAVFLIAMVISVSVDRRGVPHPKWIVTLLGIGGVLFLTRDSWTLSSLGDFVLSATFWVPLLKYLGAGLAYSFVEFARETRLSAKRLKDDWESFLNTTAPTRGRQDDDHKKMLRDVHAIKKFRFEDHPYCGPIVQHKGVCQWKAEIPTMRWVFDLGVTT